MLTHLYLSLDGSHVSVERVLFSHQQLGGLQRVGVLGGGQSKQFGLLGDPLDRVAEHNNDVICNYVVSNQN